MAQQKDKRKGFRELFAQFFEQPTRPALRKLLEENIGEFDHVDFKEQWPERPKLARDILGFANSSGGVIVVGVKQTDDNHLSAEGLSTLTDKTEIHNAVKKYLPDDVDYNVLDLAFTETEYASIKGKSFQVLLVENRPEHLPFVATADGDGVKAGMIYVRDGVSTTTATHSQLQKLLNRRIATGHSTNRELTLKEHLDELETLYTSTPKRISHPIFEMVAASSALSRDNSYYPKESFEAFMSRMIQTKKEVIEHFLRNDRC